MQFLEKLWNIWDIKVVTTEERRNYIFWEPTYHTTVFFSENLLATEMEKHANKKTNIYE